MSGFIDQFEKSPSLSAFRLSWREVLSVMINAAFALVGLVLLPSQPDVGIVTLAFFGSGALFLGWLQWQRYVEHKIAFTSVGVVGGVRLLPRRGFMLVMGAWLFVLGVVLVVFGERYSIIFQGLAAFVAACGLVAAVMAMLRLLPAGFLQFEPDGLIIGQRGWHVLVPWDCIYAVQQNELHNNPVIQLGVERNDALVVTPASAQAKADKAMAGGSLLNWGPFLIFPMHYGIPTPVLAGAIQRYASDAAARKTLGERQLGGPRASV
jgi:hypothetical protein